MSWQVSMGVHGGAPFSNEKTNLHFLFGPVGKQPPSPLPMILASRRTVNRCTVHGVMIPAYLLHAPIAMSCAVPRCAAVFFCFLFFSFSFFSVGPCINERNCCPSSGNPLHRPNTSFAHTSCAVGAQSPSPLGGVFRRHVLSIIQKKKIF